MRVLFLTQYDVNGPSSRIRVYQFQPFLRELNILTDVKPLLTGDVKALIAKLFSDRNFFHKAGTALVIFAHFLKRYRHVSSAFMYDVVIVQKDVLPFGLLTLLRLINKRVVYEFDDAIWEPTPGEKRKSLLMSLIFRYRSRLFHRMLVRSTAIIAENSYLADYASNFNTNVSVLTAPIDTRKYEPRASRLENELIVLGWIGSPGTTYLLESLEGVLNEIGQRFKSVLVHNIGGLPVKFADIHVNNVPWSAKTELEDLSAFTIGLMPLDETPFNRGRLGYKMIIYASLGIPAVASDIGLNSAVIKHNQTGFLARSHKDWVDYLGRLIAEPDLRQRLGENARGLAVKDYDIRGAAQKYRALLQTIAGNR